MRVRHFESILWSAELHLRNERGQKALIAVLLSADRGFDPLCYLHRKQTTRYP